MVERVQGGACDLYVFERDVEMKRHEKPCFVSGYLTRSVGQQGYDLAGVKRSRTWDLGADQVSQTEQTSG